MPKPGNTLRFMMAEKEREALTEKQLSKITQIYEGVAKDFKKKTKFLSKKTNVSSILGVQYLNNFQKDLNKSLDMASNEVRDVLTQGIKDMASAVVSENQTLLNGIGLGIAGAYSYVPDMAVKTIVSGQLYESSWTLSTAIWGGGNKHKQDVANIVAAGMAANKPVYDIAKDLEKYVKPGAQKPWDWSKVYPGCSKKIDYNAQRLARTMTSHAYQYTFQRVTMNNPFVEAYQWNNGHSKNICSYCENMANEDKFGLGQGIFPKGELPLDHPNGRCFVTSIMTKSLEQIGEDIGDWVLGQGDQGLNANLDNFANDCLGNLAGTGQKVEQFKQYVAAENGKSKQYQMFGTGVYDKESRYVIYNGEKIEVEKINAILDYIKSGSEARVYDYYDYLEMLGFEETFLEEFVTTKMTLDEMFGVNVPTEFFEEEEFLSWIKANAKGGSKKEIMLAGDFSKLKNKTFSLNMSSTQYDAFVRELNTADEQYQYVLSKTIDKLANVERNTNDGAFYLGNKYNRKISINYLKEARASADYDLEGIMSTMFHESGHAIDDFHRVAVYDDYWKEYTYEDRPRFSASKQFMSAFLDDVSNLLSKRRNSASEFSKRMKEIRQDHNSKGVQDEMSGLKWITKIEGCGEFTDRTSWCHSDDYWNRRNPEEEIASELWANISAAHCSSKAREYMLEFFPKSYEAFDDIISKI